MDPRLGIIEERLKDVKRVIAVAGGKGGIGKSSVAATFALMLARAGHRVGLLDLDICGPSSHVILGISGVAPMEDKGIVPPLVHGIRFMSIIYYAGDNPSPMRGEDISNLIIELLTITRWGPLDFLIIDMPPGIGDPTLDIIRFMKGVEFLIITTPSKVALETVKKLVKMLIELGSPIIGVVENMKTDALPAAQGSIEALHVPFLGTIAFDEELEQAVGDVDRLAKGRFAADLRGALASVITAGGGGQLV
ncbi:MAG: P-loop NTPase [candidate division KSB1 bacterium]|nr:P-loop NTPase [candidate division KSB1 bacterium]MDZ7296147.1 P-loop NTPase [candidate division KSB1 bacterium]MDZ7384727.1 P-loop NTPase [candidate division KSB1 bacterium]MDZ7392297.1 P-loop NTPase [candidate division KSB1 bacterium]MDZ7412202.1 P-loop NTPase [candidate division KSB1 bacterium]